MATYRDAGVDLDAAARHVSRIGPVVEATWGDAVVGRFGSFAAGIELPPGYRRPVLMMSTDGVGTKLELARRSGRWEGVGFDLVAMCVDDLAAVGARPLGLVDYLAVGALDPPRDTAIVSSVAEACRAAGCALVGGETAEHPDSFAADQVDLAGAAVGVVERGGEITGVGIRPGDRVIGLASPNLRSNGFSLVRKVFAGVDLDSRFPGEDATVAEVLLRPSVVYTPAVIAAIAGGGVRGAAHVTGGGIPGNLVRTLPDGCRAVIDTTSWEIPPVFEEVRRRGRLSEETMRETFNLGIGFCLVVGPSAVTGTLAAVAAFGHAARVIGEIAAGDPGVEFI